MKHIYFFLSSNPKTSQAFLHFLLIAILFITNNVQSQGNTCSAATLLTINGTCATGGTLTDGTQNTPNIGSCAFAGSFRREGWYRFVVSSGPQTVTITGVGNNRNLYLQLISTTSDCSGTLAEIACANATDTNGTQTETITTSLNAGTYYIKALNVGSNGDLDLTSLCVMASVPCVAPSSQATTFTNGILTSTAYPATFSGSANGYLVIRSLTSTPPTQPVNGTVYSSTNISDLGTGLTFVQTGSSTSITGTGLTGNTQYYYFVFSYNNTSCTGGPMYNTSGALTGNAITCPAVPNSVAVASITSSGFTLNWAAPTGGSASAITYTVQVTTDSGYASNVTGSPFTIAAPTATQVITGLSAGTTYYYRILASNGCSSAYVSSSTATSAGSVCSSGPTIASCGTTVNATIASGNGTYGTSACGFSTPGKEQFYTFTPSTTGAYAISQTSSFDFIDYQYKTVSSGCSATGWICIDDIWGTGTSPSFTLTAGVQYYILLDPESTAGGSVSFSITCPPPPVTNDEPCSAISLTVNSSCTFAMYTTLGATATSGVTAPGCASYSGGDIWFSTVVPSNGIIEVDSNSGTMTDSGIAVYSGTCGSLTLLACDDDSSANGLMSYLSVSGLTSGSTVFIRVWEYGNDNQGTFGICLTTPTPPTNNECSAATNLTVNSGEACSTSTSGTTHGATQSQVGCTGNADDDVWYQFTATGVRHTVTVTPNTASNIVFQVFSGSCAGLSSLSCINNTTSTAETTTLSGLTIGVTYIVRVYTNGLNTGQGTFSICVSTPCALGSGTGTTTLACINPVAGETGQNGADPAAMHCSDVSCVNLGVTYLPINQTTNYTVSSITYAPPYQFSCLANQVSVNVDDVWSPIITLPFNFCFYGTTYTSCIIGSNGILSFNTANAGSGSGYSFSNDLPSTTGALFANTIYGVYHDIDPSKGGKVGYELINLTSGCRALVASWSEVPMFSDNSILYTGMMVLYENTNIIDIYIKEKRIDNNDVSPWNGGNAIVGIQNAAGTAAVVAPNRNGLSTNWSATNEAWRFTPSGAAATTTVKWFEGSGTSGTQLSTSSTFNVCPLSTTTYTAEVTYTLCSGTVKLTDETTVTVNGGKTWTGLIDTDWNKAGNWNPNTAIPTGTDCVVIPNTTNKPVVSGTSYKALAGTLAIFNNALLTINSSNSIVVTDWVNVTSGGGFLINDSASLVQINNVTNTGNITYKRIAPGIKGSDYVYWSSPVLNQDMGTIYDATFAYPSGYKYQWNTTVNNGNGASGNTGQGNWEVASGIMTRARGYIIRGSSSFGMPASNIPTTFTGTPFNGNIPYTIQRGSYTGTPYTGVNGAQITNLNDNYNLLGNPYPSAINALQFLQTNTYHATTNPTGQLLGNVKLWTHGHDPLIGVPNPFYGSFQYNYDANDYLTINYLGSTTPSAPDIIKSGQAFFVQMVDGTANTGTVNFTNSMRLDATNNPYSNSGFYKNGNATNDVISLEKHRIWLDLVDSNSESSGILLGYATDATNDYDTFFDAPTAVSSGLKLFSIIESQTDVFDIQGRTLPFDIYDEVPIGVNLPTTGSYSFAIAKVDGLFETQNIYLKDIMLNIIHDLKVSPYQFTAQSSVIKDRFKIVYVPNSLGNPDFSIDNNVRALIKDQISVSSNNLAMESIIVYNVLGQKIDRYENINTNYFTLSNLRKNNTTLLLKIKLQTGETVVRKVIY